MSLGLYEKTKAKLKISSSEVVAKSGASPSNTKAEGATAEEESPLETKLMSDLHPGAPKPPIVNHTDERPLFGFGN